MPDLPAWLMQLLGGGFLGAITGVITWRKSSVERTDSAVKRYDMLSARLTSDTERLTKEIERLEKKLDAERTDFERTIKQLQDKLRRAQGPRR